MATTSKTAGKKTKQPKRFELDFMGIAFTPGVPLDRYFVKVRPKVNQVVTANGKNWLIKSVWDSAEPGVLTVGAAQLPDPRDHLGSDGVVTG